MRSIRKLALASGVKLDLEDSDQQYVVGLSRPYVFEDLLLTLQKGVISLQFDEKFMSAKCKRAWRLQAGVATAQRSSEPHGTSKEEFHEC